VVESEIRDIASEPQKSFNFYILHLNCRSLLGNFDRFKTLTANSDTTFSIIGLSETWLNDETFITICVQLVSVPIFLRLFTFQTNKQQNQTNFYLHTYKQLQKILTSLIFKSVEVLAS
jgi:hypothetical protein